MSEQHPQFSPSVLKFRKPLLTASWVIVIFFSILVPYFGVVKLDYWLSILSPVLIIPIGFGVHKLINWIFVYKNVVKLTELLNKY